MEFPCRAAAWLLLCSLVLQEVSAQVSPSVVIERPSLASSGDRVTLKCTMEEAQNAPDNTCYFIRPSGNRITITYTNGNSDTAGYTGIADSSKMSCGLEITSVNQNSDIGQWSCVMNDNENHAYFRKGTFQLLTPEIGHLRDVRLPRHLDVYLHAIDLEPHLEGDFLVNGKMRLITRNNFYDPAHDDLLDKVYMHAKNIAIDEDNVMVRTFTKDNSVIGHEYDLEREFYIIHLGESLYVEDWDTYHLVNLSFTSWVADDLRGFYRSTYENDAGQSVTLASTQFQDIDARRAFPCLDEPDRKGRFQLSIAREESMTATSNMPILVTEEAEQPGWVIDKFRLSEQMSSYLVAFMVSDFVNTTAPADNTFNIIHAPGREDQAALAADAGPKILEYFEEYFGIEYVLPKMDMTAIPEFKYGAMENWGLITYRESALLFDETVSTQTDRDRVILVIAHELAHMWFGNLVTMEWWEDLWLNEGFASYVENIGMDFYDPQLQARDRIVILDLPDVLYIDSLESSMPVSVDVGNPAYDKTYSRLSYGKGNCLIRMIENMISLNSFNSGIQAYLRNLQYENANRNDLWNYLDASAHVDGTLDSSLHLGDIMEGWTSKEGYPVVTVTGVQGNDISLSQKRFFLNPDAPASDYSWFVPINVEYPGGAYDDTKPLTWLRDTGADLTITVASKPYILNVKQTGYYRVNYDTENWAALSSVLYEDNKKIDRQNRAQIIGDTMNLARAGQLSYQVAMTMVSYLRNEEDYIPIRAAMDNLAYLDEMFRTEQANYSDLKAFISWLLGTLYDSYGFEEGSNEVYFDALIRDEVITWTCMYGNADCIAEAKALFTAWTNENSPDSNNPIPVDIKSPVYETAVREGGSAEWDFLYERFKVSKVDGERSRMLYGLGATTDEAQILDYLDKSIDETSGIRKQHYSSVHRSLARSDIGRRTQLDWLEANFAEIQTYYGDSFTSTVSIIVSGYANGGKTQAEIDVLQDFWEAHQADVPGIESTIVQAQDSIRTNMAWNEANFATVADWLASFDPEGTTPSFTTTSTTTTTTTTTSGSSSLRCSPSIAHGLLIALITMFWRFY